MFLDFASWRAACSSLISLSRISACMGGTAPSWVRMGGRAALVRPSSGVPRCPWLAPAAPSTSAPPPSISWNCSSGMIGVWLVEFSLFLSLACWCYTPPLFLCLRESISEWSAATIWPCCSFSQAMFLSSRTILWWGLMFSAGLTSLNVIWTFPCSLCSEIVVVVPDVCPAAAVSARRHAAGLQDSVGPQWTWLGGQQVNILVFPYLQ